MRLTDLDATFLRVDADGRSMTTKGVAYADAHGVMFEDPAGHGYMCICFFREPAADGTRAPDGMKPGPARWSRSGSGLHDLTLSPSVFIDPPHGWHGFIRNGDVTNA